MSASPWARVLAITEASTTITRWNAHRPGLMLFLFLKLEAVGNEADIRAVVAGPGTRAGELSKVFV